MTLVYTEPSAAERTRPDINVCGACTEKPYPTYVVWDLPGVGRAVACSDTTHGRHRGELRGIWCTYEAA